MDFAEAIQHVVKNPLQYLSAECSIPLGAFFTGYKLADLSAQEFVRGLIGCIPGPEQLDGCSRSYLLYGGGRDGFKHVINCVQELIGDVQPAPQPGPCSSSSIVEYVRDSILSGKTGVALGEPTILWLADLYSGFLMGLKSVFPLRAEKASDNVRHFEYWIRNHYQQPHASWYEIIRVFEGVGADGLCRFVELWDEFEKRKAADSTFGASEFCIEQNLSNQESKKTKG